MSGDLKRNELLEAIWRGQQQQAQLEREEQARGDKPRKKWRTNAENGQQYYE